MKEEHSSQANRARSPMKGGSSPREIRDGDVLTATVAFLHIHTLKEQDANTVLRSMKAMHAVLAKLTTTQPIRVLSALTGAILVLPDRAGVATTPIHRLLARVGTDLSLSGLPVRVGVTRGELEALIDVDDQINLIGQPMNLAARLATARENDGCLYHASYADFASAYVARGNDPLAPGKGVQAAATGKPHDATILCWTAPAFRALSIFDISKLPQLTGRQKNESGVILAYDLPRFSAGDRAQLRSRFRGVVDALKRIRKKEGLGKSAFIFSPGGDGGLMLLRLEKELGYEIATQLVRLLRIETDNKSASAGVESRVGLHYGSVSVYRTAKSLQRPTGPACFIADALANDSTAGKSGVIISGELVDIVSGGSMADFNRNYIGLARLPDGPAKGIARYAKRSAEMREHGGAGPHQLPPAPADFTGREAELQDLLRTVRTGGAVISAAMRGMGGVGKTALALKLAALLADDYPDAQFYLDLRGASEQGPLTPSEAMAHVLRGYDPTSAELPTRQEDLAALYRSKLSGQRALLLMDNARDAAQVTPLVPPVGCLLLVTTRQRFALPGLVSRDVDVFPPEDAIKLLLSIARRIGSQAAELAELCGYLGLALRVTGSALATRRNLSPVEYVRLLGETKEHLDLVDPTTGLSVTASVRLSYDLLQPELQKRWRMLAVFPATFETTAVAAVWSTAERSAKATLSSLLEYSLVEWNETTDRYRLHDLVRQVANERLGPL